MFEVSNCAEANAIKINPGPRLLLFEHSNFAEANVIKHSTRVLQWLDTRIKYYKY